MGRGRETYHQRRTQDGAGCWKKSADWRDRRVAHIHKEERLWIEHRSLKANERCVRGRRRQRGDWRAAGMNRFICKEAESGGGQTRDSRAKFGKLWEGRWGRRGRGMQLGRCAALRLGAGGGASASATAALFHTHTLGPCQVSCREVCQASCREVGTVPWARKLHASTVSCHAVLLPAALGRSALAHGAACGPWREAAWLA